MAIDGKNNVFNKFLKFIVNGNRNQEAKGLT
jgi:hypothetical protein